MLRCAPSTPVRSPSALAGLLLVVGALTGCEDKTAADPPAAVQGEAPSAFAVADDGSGVPKHLQTMDHNFYAATSMIDAVAAGRLDLAQQFAELLTKLPDPGIDNKPWKDGLAVVRERARAVMEAKDLDEAAKASGRALTSCAACHQKIAGPTPVSPDDSPIQSDAERKKAKTKILLKEHQWAFERLLEGAYFPDVEGWRAGSRALEKALLVEDRDRKAHPEAVTAEKLVRSVDVKGATTDDARAAAYGTLLGTCYQCHSALGVEVRPPDKPE